MSVTLVLRIVAVAALGLVVAQSGHLLLMRVAGRDRRPRRELLGHALSGVGAFLIAWDLLPGGPVPGDNVLFMAGLLVWIAGALVESWRRPPRDA